MDLDAFYAGDRQSLVRIYRDHVGAIERVVRRHLHGVDAEGVVHDLFRRLIDQRPLRLSFQGGDIGAWLASMAADQARAALRDQRGPSRRAAVDPRQDRVQAARLRRSLGAFISEVAPTLDPELQAVVELRFTARLDQRAAARSLGISRSALVRREARVLQHLDRFLGRTAAQG